MQKTKLELVIAETTQKQKPYLYQCNSNYQQKLMQVQLPTESIKFRNHKIRNHTSKNINSINISNTTQIINKNRCSKPTQQTLPIIRQCSKTNNQQNVIATVIINNMKFNITKIIFG